MKYMLGQTCRQIKIINLALNSATSLVVPCFIKMSLNDRKQDQIPILFYC